MQLQIHRSCAEIYPLVFHNPSLTQGYLLKCCIILNMSSMATFQVLPQIVNQTHQLPTSYLPLAVVTSNKFSAVLQWTNPVLPSSLKEEENYHPIPGLSSSLWLSSASPLFSSSSSGSQPAISFSTPANFSPIFSPATLVANQDFTSTPAYQGFTVVESHLQPLGDPTVTLAPLKAHQGLISPPSHWTSPSYAAGRFIPHDPFVAVTGSTWPSQ